MNLTAWTFSFLAASFPSSKTPFFRYEAISVDPEWFQNLSPARLQNLLVEKVKQKRVHYHE